MRVSARFISDRKGATLIEYGMIAALIAVVGIAALDQLQTGLNSRFSAISVAVAGTADISGAPPGEMPPGNTPPQESPPENLPPDAPVRLFSIQLSSPQAGSVDVSD